MKLIKAYFYIVFIALNTLIIFLCNNLFVSLFVIMFIGFGLFSFSETLKDAINKIKCDVYTKGL